MDLWLLSEAEASFRLALVLEEDHAGAHDKLGVTLRLQGRGEEALESCRRALELDPDHVDALLSAAQLASDRGEFAEAERIFRRALTLAPKSPEALAGLVGLRKMTTADAVWALEALKMANLPLPASRAAKLRYAIGKYFDDTGEPAQAFAHYRIANELSKHSGTPHDRSQWQQEVDTLMRRFDRGWLGRNASRDNPSSRPVLIVGMPRSGTTLMEQILAAHPAVHGAGELAFWVPALSKYASEEAFVRLTRAELQQLARGYLRLLDEQSAVATQVVDKMPGNFRCAGLIHAAFPNARIINVLRNPIDTCLSVYFQDFNATHSYAKDLEDLAHYYRQYLKLMNHWREVLPQDAFLQVVYEDLIDDPETWTRKMLQFVGQPWDSRCLHFDTVNASASVILTFSQWRARQKISNASVARWRKYEQFLGPLLPLAEEQEAYRAIWAERP
jgi:tetratricopeptide (TPR) repeat protein